MKLKNTAIVTAAAIALIITGSFVMAPTTALAWGEDWGTGGISGGDYYDSYGVDTYDWGGSDYYDSYGVDTYGSYGGYSYPSYSSSGYSSYVPSSSGYSYTPASTPSYSYTPSSASNYSYTPSTSSSYQYSPTSSSANSTSAATASNSTYVSSTNTNTNTNNLANTNTLNQTYNPTNTVTYTPTNTNVYTPTNVFNPVNNNDARINLIVLGGSDTTGTTNTTNLSVNCVISPSTVYVNQNVTFTANASGGNGSYTYSWTGSDGISASSQSFTGMFSYTGTKTATVTVSSNGQTASASCNATVQGSTYTETAYCVANPTNGVVGQNVTWTAYTSNSQYSGYYGSTYQWSGSDNLYGSGQTISHVYNTAGYHTAYVTIYSNGQTYTASCNTNISGYTTGGATVIRDTTTPTTGTPVAGVFLSQVPATGISFGLKMTLFTVGLLMWSLFAAYIVSVKRKAKLAGFDGSFGFGNTAGAGSDNVVARINAFKEANLRKKNLI